MQIYIDSATYACYISRNVCKKGVIPPLILSSHDKSLNLHIDILHVNQSS